MLFIPILYSSETW